MYMCARIARTQARPFSSRMHNHTDDLCLPCTREGVTMSRERVSATYEYINEANSHTFHH